MMNLETLNFLVVVLYVIVTLSLIMHCRWLNYYNKFVEALHEKTTAELDNLVAVNSCIDQLYAEVYSLKGIVVTLEHKV